MKVVLIAIGGIEHVEILFYDLTTSLGYSIDVKCVLLFGLHVHKLDSNWCNNIYGTL